MRIFLLIIGKSTVEPSTRLYDSCLKFEKTNFGNTQVIVLLLYFRGYLIMILYYYIFGPCVEYFIQLSIIDFVRSIDSVATDLKFKVHEILSTGV